MLPTSEIEDGMIVVRFPDDDIILYFSYGNLIGFRNKRDVYVWTSSIDDTTNRHLTMIKRRYTNSPFILHECVNLRLALQVTLDKPD